MKKNFILSIIVVAILGMTATGITEIGDFETANAEECDFTYRVTNYTLTIINNNEPVTGHKYVVNWGYGNYQTYDPAVKIMEHHYPMSISAHVSIDVYAKTPSRDVKVGTYYLKDGQSINIGDHQENPNAGLVIYPNGATLKGSEEVWEQKGIRIVLPECPYEWENHEFRYYSYDTRGTGVKLMPGEEINPQKGVYLYCIWKDLGNTDSIPGVSYPDNSVLVIVIGAVALLSIFGLIMIRRH